MASANPAQVQRPSHDSPPSTALSTLSNLLPHIPLHTSTSSSFAALTRPWNLAVEINNANSPPIAVLQPHTASDISTIVRFSTSHDIPLTVKSGGHDLCGRSRAGGALIIDMGQMRGMQVADDRKSVVIGGGVLSGDVVNFLAGQGLVTAVGFCGTVGMASWCCGGGYGLASGFVGMGCDQIIGATIVDGRGEVRMLKGDDEELWGVRGAGTALGVVVELVLKTYPAETGLYGFLAFPVEEAESVLEGYSKLRVESVGSDGPLGVELAARMMGDKVMLNFIFTWVEEKTLKEGRMWLSRMRALGTCVFDTVTEGKPLEFQTVLNSDTAEPKFTKIYGILIEKLTPKINSILVKHAAKLADIKDPGCNSIIGTHTAHAAAISTPAPSSFGNRRPHIIVEIAAMTLSSDPAVIKRNFQWVEALNVELRACGEVLQGGYVNLMAGDEPMNECYGTEWERLLALKRKWDPNFVFKHSVPDLASAYNQDTTNSTER